MNLIESVESHLKNFNFQLNHEKILQSYASFASILSAQILVALQWQEFFHTISYLENSILTAFIRSIPTESKFSEIIEEQKWTERIDVREVDLDDLRIKEEAGKKGGKKKTGGKNEDENKKSDQENKNDKGKEEEEKRLREWEKAWNEKLEAKEVKEDKAFCENYGFYPKPKTQTNLWIQVNQEKGIQDVQFCLRNVPVPKPKPPPLPPLKLETPVETTTSAKNEKKGGKKKGKKKK